MPSDAGQSLAGRATVVTGSSRGLGRAFALELAGRGMSVVVNGTDRGAVDATVSQIRSAGGTAIAHVGSVVDDDYCNSLVGACVEEFGQIDLMVTNAGFTRDRSFMKMSKSEWDDVVAIHLTATWSCSQAAALAMKSRGGGILNISSGAGLFGMFGQSNYSAAKAGVVGLSRVLHLELARYGIRCNVLTPVASTGMTEVFGAEESGVVHASKFPPPETVAPIVGYLAGDAARDIAGQVLSFDGSTLSIWSHPEPMHSVTRETRWGDGDFADALPVSRLQNPHPDRWGLGASES